MLVLHDYYASPEGGGRLAHILAKQLGADLAYGFRLREHPFFAQPLPSNEIDLNVRIRFPLLMQYSLARSFQHKTRFVKDHDAAIYSGFYAPLANLEHPAHKNIYYCHTPPRFIYDLHDHYASSLFRWQRPLLQAFVSWLRPRYEKAVNKMDFLLTNSHNVQRRIKAHLGLESYVVYPPCETGQYTWNKPKNYYLSAARLDPLKRIDAILRAFMAMPDKSLVVLSDGPDKSRLQNLAAKNSNITFVGKVTEAEYTSLLSNCIASIYIPREEDFGMTAVESLASGKPVIASSEGGLLEIIEHQRTGLLISCDDGNIESHIQQAVHELDASTAASMKDVCFQSAQRFDVAAFINAIRHFLDK